MGPEPAAVTPDKVPITVAVQLKVAVTTVDVGVKLSGVALQISCTNEVGVFVITGFGVTFTTTEIGVPLQPFEIGVITYVIEPELMPSALVKV
jgi:hypothetical protein